MEGHCGVCCVCLQLIKINQIKCTTCNNHIHYLCIIKQNKKACPICSTHIINKYKIFTLDEVIQHKYEDDCWLIAHGYVYDVTSFIEKHPAGKSAILRHSGTESSIDYDFHSKNAKKLWLQYKIGYIKSTNNCIIS